ncbi:hypothetical protein DXA16_04425 [Streptococcus anginosus]|nr:hypothetical protein DXA16_04425 [Streptococcus anginosus]
MQIGNSRKLAYNHCHFKKENNFQKIFSKTLKFYKGTIYQFTLDTIYSTYENIKKGDFQAEIVF